MRVLRLRWKAFSAKDWWMKDILQFVWRRNYVFCTWCNSFFEVLMFTGSCNSCLFGRLCVIWCYERMAFRVYGETMSSIFNAILSSKSGCWLDHVINVYLATYVIVLFMKEWHSWFTFSLIIKLQFIQFNVHVCVTNVCCKVHNFWELSWQLESQIATIRGEFTEGCVTNGTWDITYQYMCMHR
jgi:hypothetical protein